MVEARAVEDRLRGLALCLCISRCDLFIASERRAVVRVHRARPRRGEERREEKRDEESQQSRQRLLDRSNTVAKAAAVASERATGRERANDRIGTIALRTVRVRALGSTLSSGSIFPPGVPFIRFGTDSTGECAA